MREHRILKRMNEASTILSGLPSRFDAVLSGDSPMVRSARRLSKASYFVLETLVHAATDAHENATPLDRAMFHYWSPWRVVFRVRFPVNDANGNRILPENTRSFTLRFAGAYGTANLRWDVRAP